MGTMDNLLPLFQSDPVLPFDELDEVAPSVTATNDPDDVKANPAIDHPPCI